MTLPIDEQELRTRIDLSYDRLANGDYYRIDQIFSPSDYDWYGDKEGRALLYADLQGAVRKCGRVYADGDLLYAELSESALPFAEKEKVATLDGHTLYPLLKMYRLPNELVSEVRQRVLF